MTTCLNCDRGRFQLADEQNDCVDCAVGRSSSLVARATEGDVCSAGRYQSETGTTACLNCIPGQHQPATEQTSCKQCEINWYANDTEMAECKECVVGKYARKQGSASCQSCGAGEYGAGCRACPQGWYRSADDKIVAACRRCSTGETTLDKTASASCSSCDLGKFGSSPGECSKCDSGKYQDAKKELVCKPCPVDTYFDGDQATALSQCESCPQDRTTGAAISCTSSAACLCKKEDYFQSDDDATKCLTCPEGAACPIDGSYLMHIHAKPGFWMPSNLTKELVDCGDAFSDLALKELARQRCCPPTISDPEQTSCSVVPRDIDWTTDDQCEKGYSGPLCVACSSTHVLYEGECIECDGGSPLWVGILGLIGVALLLFFVALVALKKTIKSQEHVEETRTTRLTGMLSIIISWLQILSALTVTYKMAWPSDFATYSQGTGAVVNLEIMSVLAVGSCQLAVPFINKFLLQILTPPLFITSVFLAWVVLKCCHGKQKGWKKVQKARTEVAQSFVVVIVQLLYPKLATRTFQMFRCVDLGPKIGRLLDADFSKKCFEGVHAEYVPFAIFSFALYLVGLPLGTFFILYLNRKKLASPEFESKYGDLYRQYDKEWYFWECLLMIQKCFLTGAMCAIAPGSPIQLLCALVLCMSYLLLVLHAGPYKGDLEDRLAFLTSLCLSASLLLGLTIITDKPDNPVFDLKLLGIVLIIINVLPFLFVVYASVQILRFGPNVGVRLQDMEVDSSRNSARRKGRQKTMDLVGKAVTHEVVNKAQQEHSKARNAALAKIEQREIKADARVRQRLAERRRKKNSTKVQPSSVVVTPESLRNCAPEPVRAPAAPEKSAEDEANIQQIRSLLRSKIQTEKKLSLVFDRLDADGSKTMSKTEFAKLMRAIVKKKKKLLTDRFLELLWMSASHLRKSGDGEIELDVSTLRAWLFEKVENEVNKDGSMVAQLEVEAKQQQKDTT